MNDVIQFGESYKTQDTANSVFEYSGSKVRMRKVNDTIQVCVSDFAKAFPRKNLSNIVNSKEIKDYVRVMSDIQNCSSLDLLQTSKGNFGNGQEQGTWAHQRVALRIAQKLSTEFSIWVDERIEELLTTGTTSTHPKTGAEMLLLYAQQMVEQERRINEIEGKQNLLEQKIVDIEQRTDTNIRFTTIVGFANRFGIRCPIEQASVLGKKAVSICKKFGYNTGKIPDPRFGMVRTYPDEVLIEVFEEKFPNMNFRS